MAKKKKAIRKKASTRKRTKKTVGPDLSRPRRFEFVGGTSEKFWTISLQECAQTVQYGRLGTPGQTKTKEFANRGEAEASYEKLIAGKLKKGYEEQVPPTPAELKKERKKHEPFLKEILSDPNDPATYAVYGDWLSERGDPRGEFIQIQLQLEDENLKAADRKSLRQREKQLLARYEETWLGDLAPLLMENPTVSDSEDYRLQSRPNFTYRFERGFVASLRVARLFVPVARAIRDAAETRFLRELIVESIEHNWDPKSDYAEEDSEYAYEPGNDVPTWKKDRIQSVSIYPLLGIREFTCLRSFQVGSVGQKDDVWHATPADNNNGDCHCYCHPAVELVHKMPRLENLDLLCKEYDIELLFASRRLKNLKSLRIYHMGKGRTNRRQQNLYEYPLKKLAANRTFANLEELAFHPHCDEYHREFDRPCFLPLDQVKALLKSKHLKKLTRLQLRLSNMGDEGCREIVRSGILKQLKWLDLRHGRITDEGAQILADCPDLKKLQYLDLARNSIGKVGARALRKTKVKFQAGNPLTAREFEEEEYLRDGDFE